MTDLSSLEADLSGQIAATSDVAALEAVRVAALGKTGQVSLLLKSLGAMSPDERREQGPLINGLRDRLTTAITERRAALDAAALEAQLAAERVDLTLPAPPRRKGGVHPTMQVMDEMVAIFAEMGFAVAEGPDIEDDFHNFTGLNFPPRHPAREMHDTFFFAPGPDGERKLLRTHTSPIQVRVMQKTNERPVGPWASGQEPPIRIIAPGRTYRSDYDMTHTPMFHQVEGLVIDETTHMGHLRGCLIEFLRAFFQIDDLPLRFRPSFFPFTEPSAEIDIGC
jgi:phenylalanyl-tRNA synthetase alpha chain